MIERAPDPGSTTPLPARTTSSGVPVVRTGPEGVLAHVWFTVGYRPRESLVVVALRGKRLGPVLRADLPEPSGRAWADELVAHVLTPWAGTEHDGILAVVDTPDARRAGTVATALRRARGRTGRRLVDVLHVGETSYRSLLCREARCCPPSGRPLSAVLSSDVALEHVVQGSVVREDEDALVADVEPVAADASGRRPGPAAPAGAVEAPQGRTAWLDTWLDALDGAADWAPLAEPFAAALEDPLLRDAVLVSLDGDDAAARDTLEGADAFGTAFRRPQDRERHERARTLLAETARTAGPGSRGEALAVLAFQAWVLGDSGARARLLVARALADRPGHRLATIVDGLLERVVPPPWWRPHGR